MNKQNLVDKLNSLNLVCLNDVKIGDILYYPIHIYKRKTYSFYSFLRTCAILLYRTIIKCNQFEIKGDGQNVFFLSECDYRKDQVDNFNNIFLVVDDYIKIIYQKKQGIHVKYLKYVYLYFRWFNEINKVVKCRKDTFEYTFYLYIAFIDSIEIQNELNYKNIKRLTTCNDVSPTDSLIVQLYNKKNIETVTLQHGVFSLECNNWMLRGSHSGIYMAANKFTIHEANLIGYKGKLISAGMTYSIPNECNQMPTQFFDKKICVFLEGEIMHDDNVQMMLALQDFCKNNDKEMIIKLHPTSFHKLPEYADLLDFKIVKRIICNEVSLQELSKQIDVAVIRNSTVLIQMLEFWVPSFIYYTDDQVIDVYKSAPCEFRFSSEKELIDKLDGIHKKEFMKKMIIQREFFFIENSKDNYRKFYTN